MAVKRKFEGSDESAPNCTKQLRLIPFPNYEPDLDVAMSDIEPTSALADYPYHSRLPSDASSSSSSSVTNSPVMYPTFDLYPLPFFNPQGGVDTNSHSYLHIAKASTPPPDSPNIGLLQPQGSFAHHGCTQIPKLQVACATGLHGSRTMWSFCEQCGAISMVDTD